MRKNRTGGRGVREHTVGGVCLMRNTPTVTLLFSSRATRATSLVFCLVVSVVSLPFSSLTHTHSLVTNPRHPLSLFFLPSFLDPLLSPHSIPFHSSHCPFFLLSFPSSL